MKKLSLIIAVLISSTLILSAQDKGIKFEHSEWKEVLKKAKKENKIIMMDAYTTWCGPCKWMAKNTFTDEKVGKFYNANFVNTKFDMEKGEGPELAQKYGVRAYPTILYINGDGELVHVGVGALDGPSFIQLGKTALDDKKNFLSLGKAYKKNSKDAETVFAYCNALRDANQPFGEVVSEYLGSLKSKEYLKTENWQIIKEFSGEMNSDAFKYVVANTKKFYDAFGKEEVDAKIFMVYKTEIYKAFNNRSLKKKEYEAAKKTIADTKYKDQKHLFAETDLIWYQYFAKDMKAFGKAAVYLFENYGINDAGQLNSYAWSIYENCDDKKVLKAAIKMADKSLELNENYMVKDTKAALLFKTGQYKAALKLEKEALEECKAAGEDTAGYEELIKKIEAAMKK